MKTLILKLNIVFALILLSCYMGLSQKLNKNLIPLKPFLNKTWEGKLKTPDGSKEFAIQRTFEVLPKAKVINSN